MIRTLTTYAIAGTIAGLSAACFWELMMAGHI